MEQVTRIGQSVVRQSSKVGRLSGLLCSAVNEILKMALRELKHPKGSPLAYHAVVDLLSRFVGENEFVGKKEATFFVHSCVVT